MKYQNLLRKPETQTPIDLSKNPNTESFFKEFAFDKREEKVIHLNPSSNLIKLPFTQNNLLGLPLIIINGYNDVCFFDNYNLELPGLESVTSQPTQSEAEKVKIFDALIGIDSYNNQLDLKELVEIDENYYRIDFSKSKDLNVEIKSNPLIQNTIKSIHSTIYLENKDLIQDYLNALKKDQISSYQRINRLSKNLENLFN